MSGNAPVCRDSKYQGSSWQSIAQLPVFVSIGSLLVTFAGVRQDLCMCNFVRTWKMTCGSKKRASARSSVIVFLFHVVVPVMKYCLILLLAVHFPRLCQYPSGSSAAVVSHSGRRMNSGAALPLATAEATLPSSTSLSEIREASDSSMHAATDLRPWSVSTKNSLFELRGLKQY